MRKPHVTQLPEAEEVEASMNEQQVMVFDDPHQAAFERFKETVEGGRFLDSVYRRCHVLMLDGKKIGLKRICEDVRWDTHTRYNNVCTSPMARWLIAKDRRFADVIELRQRHVQPKTAKDMIRKLHATVGAAAAEVLKQTA